MRKGSKMSEESRRKISEANRGRVSPMLGRKQSEEAKRKNREVHLGRPPNAGSFKKGNKINLGKKHSEKSRRQISETQRGNTIRQQPSLSRVITVIGSVESILKKVDDK